MGKWPMVKLGEALRKSETWIALRPEDTYKQITVKLWGKGVVLRGIVAGTEIAASQQLQVKADQFILSRIDARNGAFGLVPSELDGGVVSNDFPVFDVVPTKMLPGYMGWLCKTRDFVDQCRQASEGTTNRVRLKEDRFLEIPIPLPPLAEQRRIVARIDALAAKIDEARGLRKQAGEFAQNVLVTQAEKIFSDLVEKYPPRSFGDFEPHVTSGPRNWGNFVSEKGQRFYRAQDIGPNGNIQDDNKAFITPPDSNQGRSAILQDGDLMLVITGATVGRCSVYTREHEPGFVNQHVALCRLPKDKIDPFFALWFLRSLSGQEQLLGQRYGQGKPGLNLTNIRSLSVPVSPLPEQRRIVTRLDALQAQVDALKQAQAASAAELDALLPSVLDRAFKGEG